MSWVPRTVTCVSMVEGCGEGEGGCCVKAGLRGQMWEAHRDRRRNIACVKRGNEQVCSITSDNGQGTDWMGEILYR